MKRAIETVQTGRGRKTCFLCASLKIGEKASAMLLEQEKIRMGEREQEGKSEREIERKVKEKR